MFLTGTELRCEGGGRSDLHFRNYLFSISFTHSFKSEFFACKNLESGRIGSIEDCGGLS